jgi:hypothetical protein
MSYILKVLIKTLMVPIFLVMIIPALILFIFNPDVNKIKLKMER